MPPPTRNTSRVPPLTNAGRILFALALLGFGLQYALYGHLAAGLPPLPYWFRPGHGLSTHAVAYTTAGLLIASALALLTGWHTRIVSLLLGLLLLAAALLHLTHLHAVLWRGGPRTAFLEPLALAGAAGVLHGLVSPSSGRFSLLAGRILFAVAMIVFGVQHFLYPGIAGLIPRWIRFHHFWVIFTGVVFIAAGVALLIRRADRFAAVSLSAMFFGWLLLLHVPLIAAHPRNGDLWSRGFVVIGLCGSALILAASSRASGRGTPARGSARPRQKS